MTRTTLIGGAVLAVGLTACGDGGGPGRTGTDFELEIEVDGAAVELDPGDVVLCREGLPEDLAFSLLRTVGEDGAECPEQFVTGGAGVPISRGPICDELTVQVIAVEPGRAVAARGFTDAVLAFHRYGDDPVTVTTGDTGSVSGAPTGTVTIEALEPVDDDYRIRFSLEITGGAFDVAAGGEVIATPEFCTSG